MQVFIEKQIPLSLPFMEPKYLLSCSQYIASGLYHEPYESNTNHTLSI